MELPKRYLGRTGIRVSPLTLGCMMFGGLTFVEDSKGAFFRDGC